MSSDQAQPRRFIALLVTCCGIVVAAPSIGAAPIPDATPAETTAAANSPGGLSWLERSVLERNSTLAAARAAWAEARARSDRAGALESPMIEAMVAPRSLRSTDVAAAYRMELTQPLPLFGERGLRRASSRSEAEAAGEDLRMLQLDLIQRVRVLYFEYYRLERSREANQELAVLVQQIRQVALARYSSGTVDQQDPLRAEVELAMRDHMAVDLHRQIVEVVAELNTLMHRSVEAEILPPPTVLPAPDTLLHHLDLAPRARAQRPELRSADAHVRAASADLRLAGRSRLPEGSLGVAYDRFWNEPELRTSVTLGLTLPLVPGRTTATTHEAQAALARREAERDAMYDRVELEVARAAARLHEQAHEVQIAEGRLVPLSARALQAARASYESGHGDFTALVNAVRDHLQARIDAATALANLQVARADLDRALGLPVTATEGGNSR